MFKKNFKVYATWEHNLLGLPVLTFRRTNRSLSDKSTSCYLLYANIIRPHGTKRSCRGQRLSILKPIYRIGNLPGCKGKDFFGSWYGPIRANEGERGRKGYLFEDFTLLFVPGTNGIGRPKGPKAQRPKGSKAQKPEGPKAQKPKGPKAQKPKGPKAQKPKGPKAQKPKGSKAQRSKGSKGQKPKGSKH